jgi:hypothetical protein
VIPSLKIISTIVVVVRPLMGFEVLGIVTLLGAMLHNLLIQTNPQKPDDRTHLKE